MSGLKLSFSDENTTDFDEAVETALRCAVYIQNIARELNKHGKTVDEAVEMVSKGIRKAWED